MKPETVTRWRDSGTGKFAKAPEAAKWAKAALDTFGFR